MKVDKLVPQNALLVHLTDLHIKSETSPAFSRVQQIAGSIGSLIEDPTEVFLLISGDVAFSGSEVEYQAAARALAVLRDKLASWSVTNIHVVPSPGNHDCNFRVMPDAVRDALLASPELDGDNPEVIVDATANIQSAFYNFASDVSKGTLTRQSALVYSGVFDVGETTFKFVPINTSWSSKIEETPGTLRMPSALLPPMKERSDFCVAIAHHPLNWFTPRDAVRLSEWLDETADMVLWGHEHRLDQFRQVRERVGSSVDHQVGLPLDDPTSQCGFKCLRIDLTSRQTTEFDVILAGDKCRVVEGSVSHLHQNGGRERGGIRFSHAHMSFLEDPGAGFSHPRVNRAIVLSDLFVPPEFREFQSDKPGPERVDSGVRLSDVCEAIASTEGRFVVFGAETSGKTTFAKHLIGNVRSNRLVSIYLDGLMLKSVNKGEIRGWLNAGIAAQYGAGSSDSVLSMDPGQVVLIVDNAHAIPGGSEGVEFVVGFVGARAKRIVLLTADNPAVSIVTSGQQGDEIAYWKGASVYELLPLGHKRRGDLIRKWVALGRNQIEESTLIEAEVRQIKGLLDKVLGKNSLPKYPLFVLVLLQQIEGMKGNRTVVANGSHGYLFEALISQSIDRFVRSHEISTVNDFLAAFAHDVWLRDGGALSQSAVDDLIASFLANLVSIDGVRLLKELDDAKVITAEAGLYRFRYHYLYYYYLAKWICSNKASSEAEVLLARTIALVHTEQSSNVLMFIAHLEEEQLVISRLLPLLEGLFKDSKPCLLQSYSALSVRFRTSEQRAVLLQGAPKEVSDQHHSEMDSADQSTHSSEESPNVEDGLKFNTTLKAIHTMGQVLKSRATSIDPEQKVEIAKVTMRAGRRLMSFLYGVTEANAEAIVHSASEAFEKAFKLNREQAVRVANSMIGAIVSGIANICVGRVADALASGELKPLIDRLSNELSDEDSRLILLVARVIGDKAYPKEQVEDFVRALKPANVLPIGVLAATVARRFYLDPPERGIRDSACALLGIKVSGVAGKAPQVAFQPP